MLFSPLLRSLPQLQRTLGGRAKRSSHCEPSSLAGSSILILNSRGNGKQGVGGSPTVLMDLFTTQSEVSKLAKILSQPLGGKSCLGIPACNRFVPLSPIGCRLNQLQLHVNAPPGSTEQYSSLKVLKISCENVRSGHRTFQNILRTQQPFCTSSLETIIGTEWLPTKENILPPQHTNKNIFNIFTTPLDSTSPRI